MIYIDHPPHTGGWCHLFADSIEELHRFAEKHNINRCWFENKRGKFQPHYDVGENRILGFLEDGARFVNWRDTPKILRTIYYDRLQWRS